MQTRTQWPSEDSKIRWYKEQVTISLAPFSGASVLAHTPSRDSDSPTCTYPPVGKVSMKMKWSHSYCYSWLPTFLKGVDVEHPQLGDL